HSLNERVRADARTDGARAWGHRLLHAAVGVRGEHRTAQPAEHDAVVVDHDACIPARVSHALPTLGEPFVEPARRDVAVGGVARSAFRAPRAFARKPERAPALLPWDEVVDAGKAERFEPHRGSWAHVSLVVVAVDDHRAIPLELARRAFVELPERNV